MGNFLSLFIKLLHLLMICHVMENKQNSICMVACRVTFVLNLGESVRVKNWEIETILHLILPNLYNTIRIVDAYAKHYLSFTYHDSCLGLRMRHHTTGVHGVERHYEDLIRQFREFLILYVNFKFYSNMSWYIFLFGWILPANCEANFQINFRLIFSW